MRTTPYIMMLLASLGLAIRAQSGSGLFGEMLPPDVTICKGEPLTMTFVATNLTTGSLRMSTDPRFFVFRICPAEAPGDECSFSTMQDGFGPPPNILPPGQTIEVSVALPFFMHETQGFNRDDASYHKTDFPPGKYNVVWEFDQIEPECPPLSGKFSVTLLARDENHLREKYSELTQIIQNRRSRFALEHLNGNLTPTLLLYSIRDPVAVPIIGKLLQNEDRTVTLHAVNALRFIGTPECIKLLKDYRESNKLSDSEDYYVAKCIEGIKNRLNRGSNTQP